MQPPQTPETSESPPIKPAHLSWLQVPADSSCGADILMAIFFHGDISRFYFEDLWEPESIRLARLCHCLSVSPSI